MLRYLRKCGQHDARNAMAAVDAELVMREVEVGKRGHIGTAAANAWAFLPELVRELKSHQRAHPPPYDPLLPLLRRSGVSLGSSRRRAAVSLVPRGLLSGRGWCNLRKCVHQYAPLIVREVDAAQHEAGELAALGGHRRGFRSGVGAASADGRRTCCAISRAPKSAVGGRHSSLPPSGVSRFPARFSRVSAWSKLRPAEQLHCRSAIVAQIDDHGAQQHRDRAQRRRPWPVSRAQRKLALRAQPRVLAFEQPPRSRRRWRRRGQSGRHGRLSGGSEGLEQSASAQKSLADSARSASARALPT